MTTTTNYGFYVAEGTDTVNLLTQCYPNFTSLDSILKEIDDNDITAASETKSGTVHQLVRSKANRNVMRFTATSNFALGDTFTVDGSPVTAVTVAGTALQTGDFVINSNVIAILNGAQLTVYAGGSAPTPDAGDISYDNSVSGLTAADVQAAIDELDSTLDTETAKTSNYDFSSSSMTPTTFKSMIQQILNKVFPALYNLLYNGTPAVGVTLSGVNYTLVTGSIEITVGGGTLENYVDFGAVDLTNYTTMTVYSRVNGVDYTNVVDVSGISGSKHVQFGYVSAALGNGTYIGLSNTTSFVQTETVFYTTTDPATESRVKTITLT